MNGKADVVFLGGSVLTVDARNTVAGAVAVKGDRILATGASRDIGGLVGPDTKVYRLHGETVMPGFIEAHNHMSGYGLDRLGVDCKNGVNSIEDIKVRIRKAAQSATEAVAGSAATSASSSAGGWIRAWGYDQSKLAEQRHPTRWDLDEVAPDRPVILRRTCGHIAVANTRALQLVGVLRDGGRGVGGGGGGTAGEGDRAGRVGHEGGRDLVDPPGGKFGRTEDGRLNGVLYEAAQQVLRKAAAPSYEEVRQAMLVTDRDYVRLGITSSHDAGSAEGAHRAMAENAASGASKLRIYFMIRGGADNTMARNFYGTGLSTGFGNDRLRIGPYKAMTDGSSSGPTAGTRQPYTSQPDNSGILYFSQKELNELIEEAHAHGYQVTTHAVGDRAIEMTLNAIESALSKWPRADHRHRIEHCAICPPDLVERVKRLGVVPVAQPIFFWEFGDGYLRNYGPERVRWMFPARTYAAEGIIAAGSSDCPVTRVDPVWGIYEALSRTTVGGQSAGAEERIGLFDAVRMFTINGAYASFEEKIKGSLEPGKLADLIVLDRNLIGSCPEDIRDAAVALTMIGGEVAYQLPGEIGASTSEETLRR